LLRVFFALIISFLAFYIPDRINRDDRITSTTDSSS
jgi:hypothetical protein